MTITLLSNAFAKINQVNLVDDIDVLEIKHQYCNAKVSLYAGQVLSYQPLYDEIIIGNSQENLLGNNKNTEQQDVFWLSDDAYYQQGKAIRGGVPLCWPWFGANDKATAEIPSTNHGFAREVTWEIENIEADKTAVTVVLFFQGENQHPLWPNTFKLRQTLVFGKTFKQSLAMTNLSKDDAQYSAALHSYINVSNPKNIILNELTGCDFDDKLTANKNYQQDLVSCVGPIDRVYHIKRKPTQTMTHQSNLEKKSTVVMHDKHWQRQVEIISTDCSQWVLWNPGVQLANKMDDIHDAGEQGFVCLEAANTKWQSLPASSTITISQEIKVSAL